MTDILMATYNGEAYLDSQLNSLFSQNISDFRLIVRDDASSDGTVKILEDWKGRYPGQIELLAGLPHTGQPGTNFLELLSRSQADYTMYCDQDDVWMPEKIERTLDVMRTAEEASPQRPVLVHTDLIVVDAELAPIAPSFVRYQNLDPSFRSLPRLTAQNNATGCTMMMNSSLRRLIRIPEQPVLHDWWTALTAAAFGHIAYVNTPTVYYRQHAANAVGARNAHSLHNVASRATHLREMRTALARTYDVAELFAAAYKDVLSEEHRRFLGEYSALRSSSPAERWRILHRHSAFKKGFARAAAQILLG